MFLKGRQKAAQVARHFPSFHSPWENTMFIAHSGASFNLHPGTDPCLWPPLHTSSQLFTLEQFAFELLAEAESPDGLFVECACSGRKKLSHGMCLMENKDVQCVTLHLNSTSYLQRAFSYGFIGHCIQQHSERSGDVSTAQTELKHTYVKLFISEELENPHRRIRNSVLSMFSEPHLPLVLWGGCYDNANLNWIWVEAWGGTVSIHGKLAFF